MRTTIILLSIFAVVGIASAQYRFPPVYDDYPTGSRKALEAGKPLVTFVGVQPFEVDGAVVCMTLYLPEYPAQCIVLSKDGYYKKQFPLGTNCEVICKEVEKLKGVDRRPVDPFRFITRAPAIRSASC